jgi:hypothetical protein
MPGEEKLKNHEENEASDAPPALAGAAAEVREVFHMYR